MASQIPISPLPPKSEVEVSVKIHTPLNVSALVARQKANAQITLHCGQSFSLDEPELQVGERVAWRLRVWVTHPSRGRVACIGEFQVDAQSGEVLSSLEQFRLMKASAEGVLGALDNSP